MPRGLSKEIRRIIRRRREWNEKTWAGNRLSPAGNNQMDAIYCLRFVGQVDGLKKMPMETSVKLAGSRDWLPSVPQVIMKATKMRRQVEEKSRRAPSAAVKDDAPMTISKIELSSRSTGFLLSIKSPATLLSLTLLCGFSSIHST